MKRVFLGFGGNVGDVKLAFQKALSSITFLPGVTNARVSSLYRTSPVGVALQPDYLNCVVSFDYTLTLRELFAHLKTIELELGRGQKSQYAPRTIDIDLLAFGDEEIFEEDLIIPHPRMFERLFVLVPLAELAEQVAGVQVQKQIEKLHSSSHDKVEQIEGRNWPA
jgi:2-amino-4-hydroxy-6-hydroxymethyldihydropteridine diphosphokinase